jgi:UDP-N-acetylmuramate dehydrogenase
MTAPRPAWVSANAPLAPLTSWQIGGAADFLALPATIEEARQSVLWAQAKCLPIAVLGGGTNVLVSDRGVEGLTLCLRRLSGLAESDERTPGSADEAVVGTLGKASGAAASDSAAGADREVGAARLRLTCLAGTSKSDLLKAFLRRQLAPAFFLAGIPGDVGGGIAMNAGVGEAVRPREFVEIVDWVEILRFDSQASIERIAGSALRWGYRRCDGWQPGAIVRAGISWPEDPNPEILSLARDANRARLARQPLDQPSCGSVFVNPPGYKAGQLIEACGLKGLAIGGARVSEKHANFIVNAGGATAADIRAVVERVRATVRARAGVELRAEFVAIGRPE